MKFLVLLLGSISLTGFLASVYLRKRKREQEDEEFKQYWKNREGE
jgi:hypothetical protein